MQWVDWRSPPAALHSIHIRKEYYKYFISFIFDGETTAVTFRLDVV